MGSVWLFGLADSSERPILFLNLKKKYISCHNQSWTAKIYSWVSTNNTLILNIFDVKYLNLDLFKL